LDEIGEIPATAQLLLLRVLEGKRFERVARSTLYGKLRKYGIMVLPATELVCRKIIHISLKLDYGITY